MKRTTGRWHGDREMPVIFAGGPLADVWSIADPYGYVAVRGEELDTVDVRGFIYGLGCLLIDASRHADIDVELARMAWGVIAPADPTGRARLENAGIVPMPVYDPLTDGWDAFDTLASTYDRIVVDGFLQATERTKHRIYATLAERRRAHPHVWIHLRHTHPSPAVIVCADSVDTFQWNGGRQWHAVNEFAGTRPFSRADLPADGTDADALARAVLVLRAQFDAWVRARASLAAFEDAVNALNEGRAA